MPDFFQRARDVADQAFALHQRERRISLESVEMVGEVDRVTATAAASAPAGQATDHSAHESLSPEQMVAGHVERFSRAHHGRRHD